MKAPRCLPVRIVYWLLPVALIFLAGAPSASAQRVAVDTYERTVPLPPGGSFSISNVNGSIDIEGWNRNEVQVLARKFTTGPAESLRQVAVSLDATPDSVSISTHYSEGSGVEVNVEFRVRVPARVRLVSVGTINGAVTVHDVSGEGLLATVNGDVVLSRASGRFSARSTNGNVSLELLSLESGLEPMEAALPDPARDSGRAAVSVQTVNGSIIVAIPSQADADLDASTRNGDFSSDQPLLAHTSSAGRTIRGRVGSGGPLLLLRTVNGSIRLRISRPLV